MSEVRAFQIEQEVTINAPPAREIILEPRVGGRFFEDWGGGEGALYATVTIARRPERLRMNGSMGMGGAVAGVIDLTLTPRAGATVLRLSHRAVGEVTEETESGYRDGWRALMTERLKAYVERGVRSGLKR